MSKTSTKTLTTKTETKTPFQEAYKKLNPAQKKAVDTIDGPVLVVAGPGSGKTQVLALRVAQILQETDMRPSNVLCLTFTDSASHNMRERLISFMGEDAYRVSIHTFHNLCTSIITNNPEFFYRGATLRAADDVTKYGVIEKIIEKLPYDADLRSFHPDQGYTYIKDIIATISHIKKAGLTVADFKKVLDENDKDLIVLNERLGSILSKTVSQSSYEEFVVEFNKLHAEKGNRGILSYHSLLDALFINFNTSVAEKADFSEWKKTYAEKNTKGEYVFKDTRRADKLREVATVYEQYTELMFNLGYYDFDDMILDVLKTVEKNDILRYKIQEQYQYILVDEFQDTNDAQMRLVWLLTNNPASEGKPNIMVVGDDDQAIYKFQGAELSNIVDFTKMYSDIEVITLTENYRSNTDIVASSLSMIRTGTHRLENILKGFTKDLKSSRIFDTRNILNKKTAIDIQEFDTKLHEYTYVADQIKKAITAGIEAEHIAVIGRNHKDLVGLVPFLQKKEIPIRYEREQHVLTEPHIQQIVTILRHAQNGLTELHDDILVKILVYPFWGITTLELWKLSRLAYTERKSWIDVVQEEGQSDKVAKAIKHILEITRLAAHENAEHVIDYIINTTGFRDYYFNSEKFTHEKSEYLVFLSSLRTFVQAVREFRQGKELSVADVISFVDTYEDNKLILSDTSPFVNARNAVNLLTSHKSKGLEFEVVFILSATDKVWSGPGMPNKLKLPVNLPLAPAGDTEDDQLRLFFVALTRAKNHLYITSHRADDGGKKTNRLRFVESLGVSEGETASIVDGESDVTNILESSMLAGNRKHVHMGPHFLDTEKALLDTLTKDHVLSITHINNFLNVEKGGPMLFLENNLLRFPQAKTAPLGYGTALHAVLNQSLVCLKTEKRYPTLVEVTEWFTTQLKFERLSKADYQTHLDRGIDALKQIYVEKILAFTGDELSEVDFKHEGVVLSDGETYVPVAGKIDLIRPAGKDTKNVYVCDFKTGKEKKDWKGKDQKEKVQLHMYKQQLTFYKLLLKKSKNYSNVNVLGGQLEFLETEGERLTDLSSEIEDEEVVRLEKLVIAIYKRIQAHDFSVPAEVLGLEGLEAVERWEEVLLGE
jgi:DNA helicase II / ATP-dependent DNA helicase PcrA